MTIENISAAKTKRKVIFI